MDVVDAGAHVVGIVRGGELIQRLHLAARSLQADDIRIQRGDGIHNVAKLGVAHVGVNLGLIPHTACGQAECLGSPSKINRLVHAAQGQPLTQRRLIHLNDLQARAFQIANFITQGERNLARHFRARQIIAHQAPLQNRDGTGEHAFHGSLSERLRIL